MKLEQKSQWSDWYWGDTGIFRRRYSDWRIEEECSDHAYLQENLELLHRLKQELIDRAAQAKGTRKRKFERGIKSKEGQIEYVSKRLATLGKPKPGANNQLEESAMPENVAVEVEVVEELSEDEQRDRLHLERRVERAAFEGAEALRELRDRRLFRSTHKTFELYCQERFGFTRRRVDYLISGSEVYDNLKMRTNCSQNEEAKTEINYSQIFPTNENQVRPLTKLEPNEQCKAWQQAVDEAGGKVPSGRIVKDVVEQIKEKIRRRANLPCPFQVGEVCQIWVKGNPDLKGKGGCWCIVVEVHEFSLSVSVQGEKYQVKPENLKSAELNTQQQEEYRQICTRIEALYPKCADEPLVLAALDRWFHERRCWLSPFEEEFFQFLEQKQ